MQNPDHFFSCLKATVQSPDLATIQMLKVALQEVISAREHGAQAVPYFAPTNIGTLPPSEQEKELNIKAETEYGNRVRAAVHMTLSAALAAVEVAEILMKNFAVVDPKDRDRELIRCSLNASVARDAASDAAAILSGHQAPKSDGMVEIKRLKSALFQRFGIGE